MPETLETISKGRRLIEVLLAPKNDCTACNSSGIIFVRVPLDSGIIKPNRLRSFVMRPVICGCARFLGKRELTEEMLEALNKQIEERNKQKEERAIAGDQLPG